MTDQPDIEAIAERHSGSHTVRCVYWANSDPNETRYDTAIVIERLRAVEAESAAKERRRLLAEWDRLMAASDWPFDAATFTVEFYKLLADPTP